MENGVDNKTLAMIALRTDKWSHMVITQAKRFLEAFDERTGGLCPWEQGGDKDLFICERLFLITALHHSLEGINGLIKELGNRNDSLKEELMAIKDKIASESDIKKIRDLRNMNEHDIDYLSGHGNAQKRFTGEVERNGHKYVTNAHWTILIGDAESFTIGNVQIGDLIEKFKEQLPMIDGVCERIFMKYY